MPYLSHALMIIEVRFTMSFCLIFFGDLLNYTFLERLLPKESENQCLHFFRCVYGSHIGINKMATVKCMFFHILASK